MLPKYAATAYMLPVCYNLTNMEEKWIYIELTDKLIPALQNSK